MKFYESESIELKKELTNDLEFEVVSFLNSHSGTIYIGVNNDGEIIGINEYDKIELKIADRIRTNISPSTEGLIEINTIKIEEKFIIEIIVASGIEKPYYIKKYGMSISGCFTRMGTQTISLTQYQIDKLYSTRVKHTLSSMISPKQRLSFTQLKIYYQEKGFEEVNSDYFLENLEMYTEDGKYNYLAYLLSDNNNTSIRVAKYRNNDFIERNEYGSCCLITSINRVLDKLNIENKTAIKITDKAKRIEKRLVDPTALREAVLNMFCHNDYSVGSEPYIIIYDDRFELITYGGLPQGLTEEEFFNAKSLPRNRELMKIMNNLDMGEHIGRGMRRIMNHLKKEDFEISENFLTINFKFDKSVLKYLLTNCTDNCTDDCTDDCTDNCTDNCTDKLTKNEKIILKYMKENSKITIKKICEQTNLSKRAVLYVIKGLKDKNKIIRIGSDRLGSWHIKE